MIELKLTLQRGQPIHLFLSSNFAVVPKTYTWEGEERVGSSISDGVHNNGGWIVREQLPAVLSQIRQQQEAVA